MSAPRPCRKCGEAVPEENSFCTSCGTPTSFRPPGQASAATAPVEATSPGPLAPPRPSLYGSQTQHPSAVSGIGVTPGDINGMGGVALAHGEVVKRVYELGRIVRPFGWVQGTLVVTDVRVLYRAEALNRLSRSTLNREIHLKDVRGIGLAMRKGMSAAGFGAWLIGSILGLVLVKLLGGGLSGASYYGSSSSSGWSFILLLLWLAAVVTVFALRRRSSFVVLSVLSSDIDASPIAVTGAVGKPGGHGFLALIASPLILLLEKLGIIGADAAADNADLESIRAVYAELGAVILDLQSRGAYGAN